MSSSFRDPCPFDEGDLMICTMVVCPYCGIEATHYPNTDRVWTGRRR